MQFAWSVPSDAPHPPCVQAYPRQVTLNPCKDLARHSAHASARLAHAPCPVRLQCPCSAFSLERKLNYKSPQERLTTLAAARPLLLNRRAWHRTERTEYAAVARIRSQQRLALAALIVELAGIGRHGFLLGMAAMRTGQHGFENDGAHRLITCAQWTDSLRSSWLWSALPVAPCRRHS